MAQRKPQSGADWLTNVAIPAMGLTPVVAPPPEASGIYRSPQIAAQHGNPAAQAFIAQQTAARAAAARAAAVRKQNTNKQIGQNLHNLMAGISPTADPMAGILPALNLQPVNLPDFIKTQDQSRVKDKNVLTHPEFENYGGYIAHGQTVPGRAGDFKQQADTVAKEFQNRQGFVPAPILAATQGPKIAQQQAQKVKDELSFANRDQRDKFFAQTYRTKDIHAAVDALGGLTGDTNKDASILRASKYSGYDLTPIVRQKFVDTPEFQDLKNQQDAANSDAANMLSPEEQANLQKDLQARVDKFYQDYSKAFTDALDEKKQGGLLGQSKATIDDAKRKALDTVKDSTGKDVLNAVRQEQLNYRQADQFAEEQKRQQDAVAEAQRKANDPLGLGALKKLLPFAALAGPAGGAAQFLVPTAEATVRTGLKVPGGPQLVEGTAQKYTKLADELSAKQGELAAQATQAQRAGDKNKAQYRLQQAQQLTPQIQQAQAIAQANIPTTRQQITELAMGAAGLLSSGQLLKAAQSTPENIRALLQAPRGAAAKQVGKGLAGIELGGAALGGAQALAAGTDPLQGIKTGALYALPFAPLGMRAPHVPAGTPNINLLPVADRAKVGILQRNILPGLLGGAQSEPVSLRGRALPDVSPTPPKYLLGPGKTAEQPLALRAGYDNRAAAGLESSPGLVPVEGTGKLTKLTPEADLARLINRTELGTKGQAYQEMFGGGVAGKTKATNVGSTLPEAFQFNRYKGSGGGKIGIGTKVFNRSLNALAKVSPEAANRIARFSEDHAKLRATFHEQLSAVDKLKKSEEANFVDAARGKVQPMNARVAEAVQQWKAFAEYIQPELVKHGILNADQILASYFPERPVKGFYTSDTYAALSKQIAKERGITQEEAAKTLDSLHPEQGARAPKAGLEFQRQGKIPEAYLRKDKGIVYDYINDVSRRLAEARNLTSEGRFGPTKTNDALEAAIDTSGAHQPDIQYARKIAKELVGVTEPKPGSKFFNHLRAYQIFRKLGLGAISNITQYPVNTLSVIGGRRATQAVIKRAGLSKDKEMAKFVEDAGVVDKKVIKEQTERQVGSAGRFATTIGAPLFQPVEVLNRTMTAIGGRIYATDMAQAAARGNKRAIRALGKMDLNADEIIARGGKLTYDEQLHAARNIVERTQFLLDDSHLPLWASSPAGRTVMQFKTYAANQAAYVPREILGELKHGNFAPLARWGVASVVFGGIADETQHRIRSGVQGFLNDKLGRPTAPDNRDNSPLGRVTRAFNKGGGIGIFGNVSNFAPYYQGEKGDPLTLQALKELAGPSGSDAISLLNATAKAVGGEHNVNPLGKFLVGGAIPVFGNQAANALFPSQSQKITDEQQKRKDQLNTLINNLGGQSQQGAPQLTDKEKEALVQVGSESPNGFFLTGNRAEAYAKFDKKYGAGTKQSDDAKRAYDKLAIAEQGIYSHIVQQQYAKNEPDLVKRLAAQTDVRNSLANDRVVGNRSLVSGQDLAQFQKETSGSSNSEGFYNLQEQVSREIQALAQGGNQAGAQRLNQKWNELIATLPQYNDQAAKQGQGGGTLYGGPSTYLNTPTEQFNARKNVATLPAYQQTPEMYADFAGMSKADKAKLGATMPPDILAQFTKGAADFKALKSALSGSSSGTGKGRGRKAKKPKKAKMTAKKPRVAKVSVKKYKPIKAFKVPKPKKIKLPGGIYI